MRRLYNDDMISIFKKLKQTSSNPIDTKGISTIEIERSLECEVEMDSGKPTLIVELNNLGTR